MLGGDAFSAIMAGRGETRALPRRIARLCVARAAHAWGSAPARTGEESISVAKVNDEICGRWLTLLADPLRRVSLRGAISCEILALFLTNLSKIYMR
jgi:hypothetical protein